MHERPDLIGQPAYIPGQGRNGYTVIIGDEVFKGPLNRESAMFIENEAANLRLLEEKGVPAPRVTCVGKNSVFFGMTRTSGVPLACVLGDMTEEQQIELAREIVDREITMAKALPPVPGKFTCHGDLVAGNIMVDPETFKLTGLIDFGSGGRYDITRVGYIPASATLQQAGRAEMERRIDELPGAEMPKPVVSSAPGLL